MSIQVNALTQMLKVIRKFYQPRYKIKTLVCQRERHCIGKALQDVEGAFLYVKSMPGIEPFDRI